MWFIFVFGLHYLCSSWVRGCLSLLISIFAAHFQHAHANGLFNNGLHFRKVSDAVFYLHLSGIGKYKGLMDIVFLYLQKNTLFLRNRQIKTTLFQWFLYKNIPNKPYWLVWDMDFICGFGFRVFGYGFWVMGWVSKDKNRWHSGSEDNSRSIILTDNPRPTTDNRQPTISSTRWIVCLGMLSSACRKHRMRRWRWQRLMGQCPW